MEALRDLADDFNVRDPRKLYRLARQRDLDVTQAMAFEALKADVGRQVQAPRPRALGKSAAEGPNDRLQADLIDFSQNTRGKTKYGLVVMDIFTREAAVEPLQNKNAETVGRATKRAAKELTGDDGNFVVTTDLGNEFATLDRGLKLLAAFVGARKAPASCTAFTRRSVRSLLCWNLSALSCRTLKAMALRSSGRFVRCTASAGSSQYGDVQRLGAVDSMTVRSTEGRETLLKLALAGRLTRRGRPAAVRQLDDFLGPPRPRTLD